MSKPQKQPQPTFITDAYKGWTVEQLKQRCHELAGVGMHREIIIAVLVTQGFDSLRPEDQEKVKRICTQWDD